MTHERKPEDRALYELLEALSEHKHPSPSWIEQWSQAGRDPVHVVWEETNSYLLMLELLCHRWPLSAESAGRAVKAAIDACGVWRKLFSRPAIEGDFVPEQTQWGARLPIRLSNWLADYVNGKPDRMERVADAIRSAAPTPPPLEALSGRCAAAYVLGERIVVVGQKGHGGYYLVGSPALGGSLSDEDDALGRIARAALQGYEPNIPPDSPRGRDLMKPVLQAVGAKSNRQLQEEGRHCWIEDTPTGFVILPTHNGGNRGEQRGFSFLEDRAVRAGRDASDAELGSGLRRAFELCT